MRFSEFFLRERKSKINVQEPSVVGGEPHRIIVLPMIEGTFSSIGGVVGDTELVQEDRLMINRLLPDVVGVEGFVIPSKLLAEIIQHYCGEKTFRWEDLVVEFRFDEQQKVLTSAMFCFGRILSRFASTDGIRISTLGV